MTAVEFEDRVDELVLRVGVSLRARCRTLFSSGALDPEQYGDDFALPRIVLTAALREAISWYRPLSQEHLEAVENLTHF